MRLNSPDELPVDVVSALKAAGVEIPPDPRFPWFAYARMTLRHVAFGCTKVKHSMWDSRSHRLVEIGRICAVCGKRYPL